MKCSRLLRFGLRPSVKLLKVVIGICPPFGVSASVVTPVRLAMPVRLTLLFLGRRGRWKIGIPNIGYDLPCPVSLFLKDFDVLAAVVDRLTAGVSHRFLVAAAHVGEVSGIRYFHLGRLPTDGSSRTRQHFFPGAPNLLLCCCRRSVRRHYDG